MDLSTSKSVSDASNCTMNYMHDFEFIDFVSIIQTHMPGSCIANLFEHYSFKYADNKHCPTSEFFSILNKMFMCFPEDIRGSIQARQLLEPHEHINTIWKKKCEQERIIISTLSLKSKGLPQDILESIISKV